MELLSPVVVWLLIVLSALYGLFWSGVVLFITVDRLVRRLRWRRT